MNPDTLGEYLGDGVYASFDGYQIWLKVEREGRFESIALEPLVFRRLLAYAERMESWEAST